MFKSLVLSMSLLSAFSVMSAGKQVGSSLNLKEDIAVTDIPAEVMQVILQARPGFSLLQAEKEFKHGHVYIDVEGLDTNGNEIEFDMLKQNGKWQIVEIQRDLVLAQCPAEVVQALTNVHPQINPKRIIESEQTSGEVIYEFYTVDQAGKEAKFEVKYANGQAELLESEWQH
ncbi:hypothetical protein ACMZOO_08615 [Catenovulum sp. SX2]|uniref:hypothetical protein n=1 Tax=Catenovulum sp. SX2 TaxID=3398614 RepID=UPI003F87E1FD